LNQISADSAQHSFIAACTSFLSKRLAAIQNIKAGLLTEFGQGLRGYDRMFQLALNEAEALASETGFPLLTFPALAREKVEAVAAWKRHQRAVRNLEFEELAA
jgi:hypothetical protein